MLKNKIKLHNFWNFMLHKSYYNPSNEAGTAIILAIAISMLLIMLALAFLSSSMIEKKATRNNDAMTVARMVAQSALNRAMVSMKQVSKNALLAQEDVWSHHDVPYDYTKGYMSSSSDSAIYYDELDTNLTTIINDVEIVSSINASGTYDVTSRDAKTWIYLPLPSGYGSYPLTARIAYVVVADKGKIDASAAADSGLNAMALGYSHGQGLSESNEPLGGLGSDGTPGAIDKEITMINPDGSFVIGRPGRDVSEIFLRCLGSGTGSVWFKQVFDQKLSTLYSPAGQLSPGARWKDFKELYGAINILNSQGKITDITAANGFHSVFYLDNPPDAEAYWRNNGDDLKEESELYHRFNLMRMNWNDLSVDSIISETQKFSNDIPDNDIYSINWIRNWSSAGDFPSADSARKQIAANLIDYNDSDTSATTDNPDAPNYVGLEKCPYINEVRLKFEGKVTESASVYVCRINLDKISLELVNLYDTGNMNTSGVVRISGQFKWTPNPNGNEQMEYFSDIPVTIDQSIGSDTYSYTDSSRTLFLSPGYSTTSALPRSITDFKITNLTVKLTGSSGELYDFAYVDTGYGSPSTLTSNGSEQYLYIDYQIDDPRQNLLASDWGGPTAVGTLSNGNLGSINTGKCNPNPGGNTDPEPGVMEPYNISTAFIRNSRMLSPWELGTIHRASKWQTLNLKKYNAAENMTGGGNGYADGDANILDQIKMTDKKQVYGKISINSKESDVMRVLFQKIRIGSGYLNPGWLTAYEVNADIAQNLANNIIIYNGSYKNRTEFLGESTLVNLFTNYNSTGGNLQQTNDAKKEELVGKFINLTKATEANLFTIIAVGQAIKDVGGVTVYKDLNGDGDASDAGEQIQTVTGRFDINADEIMATQKIMATVQRSTTGDTFRIQKFEYIDMD